MRHRLLPLLLAAATAVGLAACSNPKDDPGSTDANTAVPVADVTSSIRADSALAAKLPASVRAAGALTFGSPEQPGSSGLPYAGSSGGKPVGLHVDLSDAVAKVLGIEARRVDGTFPTIVPGVQNGKFDVGLANLGVTAERLQVVDYATYLTDGQSFLGGKGVKLTEVTKLTDLCGLTVATAPGSTFQQLLEDGKDGCAKAGRPAYRVQYFSTNAPILLGLQSGKVDVEFGPTLSMKYDAKHIAGTTFLGQISSTPVGFVTAKKSPLAPVLRDAVNELIRTGAYAKILAKWGIAGSGVTKSEFNPKPSF